ncbi:Hachiman antiphage defense system protein HamA [Methylorubrum podarium]|uniref:Hachiman antiphage defense system protein HamA n=1 Tax=Methylorubrum podarium TaxID=200476 RepID=A0ABV1QU58_9HYPH
MSKLSRFFASEIALKISGQNLTAVRTGFRTVLHDTYNGYKIEKHLSGSLPYHYRKLDSVIEDFEAQHNALELMVDLMATAPTVESFRNSHGSEILACCYLEEKLDIRRLYSKLSMTTSENTNAHKMDGLFVNVSSEPYEYIFVEAKSSILPTEKTKTKSHRSGLLQQMLTSLDGYEAEEPRMELVRIRENLDKNFQEAVRTKIKADLRPPGPKLKYLGISITNSSTINSEDDDFILSSPCKISFDYYGLVVTDVARITSSAYAIWDDIKELIKKS